MLKWLASLIMCLCLPHLAFAFGVDLHAHIFMEEGVNVIYSGGFFKDKIKAKKWTHAKKSQVNEELLKRTELSIVVASLYAAPILAGETVYKSILKQIDMAELFVKRNPEWIIAHSSNQAREAIAQGKKALILSVEGGHGIHSEEKLNHLYKRGVRIITILHLTKDSIGSPALQAPGKAIFSTPINQIFCTDRDSDKIKVNCKGLTTYGEKLADRMIDIGIWIDLSHSSDKATEVLIAKHHTKKIPLLYTHGSLRTKLPYERGTSIRALEHYKKLGGIFGIVPSPNLLGKTVNCQGTADAFKEHYDVLTKYMSPEQIAVGTDANGMINHIKPRDPNQDCNIDRRYSKFDHDGGWWNYGHTFPLWQEVAGLTPNMAKPDKVVKRFLQEWARIENAKKTIP